MHAFVYSLITQNNKSHCNHSAIVVLISNPMIKCIVYMPLMKYDPSHITHRHTRTHTHTRMHIFKGVRCGGKHSTYDIQKL